MRGEEEMGTKWKRGGVHFEGKAFERAYHPSVAPYQTTLIHTNSIEMLLVWAEMRA